jgi:hypothetical protein
LAGWTSATIARYVYPPPKRGRGTPRTQRRGPADQPRRSPGGGCTPAGVVAG